MEHEDGGPAALRRAAVWGIEGGGERDAVAHRKPVVGLRVGMRGARLDHEEERNEQEKTATHRERG
jgi:hypothetical protein